MGSIVDGQMTKEELFDSIMAELDGYADRKWLPGRIEITKSRLRTYRSKCRQQVKDMRQGAPDG